MPSISLVADREKRYTILCNKYTENILSLLSPDVIEQYVPEEYILGTDLDSASDQMINFARQHLKESFEPLWNDKGVAEAVQRLEKTINDKDLSTDTKLMTVPGADGLDMAPTTKLVPKSKQVERAILFKRKMEELKQLRDIQDSLRSENETLMRSFEQTIKGSEELETVPPLVIKPPLDPSTL